MIRRNIEANLVRRFREGDEDAFAELMHMCSDVMERVYEQYKDDSLHIEKEEYMAAMTEGLLRSSYVYKFTSTVRPSFHALSYMTQDVKRLKVQYTNYEYDVADLPYNDYTFDDVLEDIYDILENDNTILQRDRKVIKYRYLHGMTVKEVASRLGVTPTRVGQIQQRSLFKISYRVCRRKRKRETEGVY